VWRANLGRVLALTVLTLLSAAAWLYLVLAHGRFWLADQRLPDGCGDVAPGGGWPTVVAVVPARDEATMLPLSLPSLLGQDYPGRFRIVLVDDASSDGTADVAKKLASEACAEREGGVGKRELVIVRSDGPPVGWAGKVAAVNRGVEAIAAEGGADAQPGYWLFTDADITHSADSVRRLVGFAEARGLDLVSLMALLRIETAAERMIVPAFVYSFAQLYPFPRVNRDRSGTAAAAGGCMLVRRSALVEAGGLERIAGARIDDVALGRLIKHSLIKHSLVKHSLIKHSARGGESERRGGSRADGNGGENGKRGRGRVWLGLTRDVRSVRPYPELQDLWDMIARSAFTQLRYSPMLLVGTLLGLVVTYAVPPILGLVFILAAALDGAGGGSAGSTEAGVIAVAGLGAWALMCGSYVPTLRLYGLGWWRAMLLPAVMMMYGAMTFDSARRHYSGRGGMWKGRASGPE
jgi:hopene-associated glycosyltransferase HpnB